MPSLPGGGAGQDLAQGGGDEQGVEGGAGLAACGSGTDVGQLREMMAYKM